MYSIYEVAELTETHAIRDIDIEDLAGSRFTPEELADMDFDMHVPESLGDGVESGEHLECFVLLAFRFWKAGVRMVLWTPTRDGSRTRVTLETIISSLDRLVVNQRFDHESFSVSNAANTHPDRNLIAAFATWAYTGEKTSSVIDKIIGTSSRTLCTYDDGEWVELGEGLYFHPTLNAVGFPGINESERRLYRKIPAEIALRASDYSENPVTTFVYQAFGAPTFGARTPGGGSNDELEDPSILLTILDELRPCADRFCAARASLLVIMDSFFATTDFSTRRTCSEVAFKEAVKTNIFVAMTARGFLTKGPVTGYYPGNPATAASIKSGLERNLKKVPDVKGRVTAENSAVFLESEVIAAHVYGVDEVAPTIAIHGVPRTIIACMLRAVVRAN